MFLGLLAIAGILILGLWYFNSGYAIYSSSNKVTDSKDEAANITAGKKYTIEMTRVGFAPEILTIKTYDTITFINKDAFPHWPISSECSGLDAHRALGTGETYAIIFDTRKSCEFHDQYNPAFKGRITAE